MRTFIIALVLCLLFVRAHAEETAGVRWSAPEGWQNVGSRPMRAVTYNVAPSEGDAAGTECVVFFFGAGDGGSVTANIERWKAQLVGPDGNAAVAAVDTRTIDGLTVTTIDASGGYTGMGGPTTVGPAVPGYRLLGAIVEGPGGNLFVKFVGPEKTIGANRDGFERLIASFRRSE